MKITRIFSENPIQGLGHIFTIDSDRYDLSLVESIRSIKVKDTRNAQPTLLIPISQLKEIWVVEDVVPKSGIEVHKGTADTVEKIKVKQPVKTV